MHIEQSVVKMQLRGLYSLRFPRSPFGRVLEGCANAGSSGGQQTLVSVACRLPRARFSQFSIYARRALLNSNLKTASLFTDLNGMVPELNNCDLVFEQSWSQKITLSESTFVQTSPITNGLLPLRR